MNDVQKAVLDGKFEVDGGQILIPSQRLMVGGVFTGDIVRNGEVIDSFADRNMVVNQGLDLMLNTMFSGTTPITSWYVGLFEGNYTPVATVDASTISQASTECLAYASATRPAFTTVASTARSITNSAARATFVFNAVKSVYGAFISSNSAKSATTGALFAAARFTNVKNVEANDELLLSYTVTASSV